MRLGTLIPLIVAVSLALAPQAHAQGSQNKCTVQTIGKVFACSYHGQPGEQICEEPGTFSACQPTPPADTGTVFGKYLILTVIYAPPGTNNGRSDSQVSYESDSTTGTTTTNSKSFKQGDSVSATVRCTDCDLGVLSGGGSFEYSKSSTRTDALAISKKTTSTIQASGPAADGIDHGHDQIWLFLHPKFDVTVSDVVGGSGRKTTTWTLDPDQSTGLVQYLYVEYLKDPSRIPPGILQDLQVAGITPADYLVILAADPLAQCLSPVVAAHVVAATPKTIGTTPKLVAAHTALVGTGSTPCQTPLPTAPRYVRANLNLPYDPPLNPNDGVPLQLQSIDNSSTNTATIATAYDYKESATISAGFNLGVYATTLQDTQSWEWTNTNTVATVAGSEQKMSLTLGGPAFGYTGPTNMDVYFDTLYNTFAFVPNQLTAQTLHGVVSSKGKPVGGRLVSATTGGVKYRTYTNAHGQYRFSAQLKGHVVVQAGTTSRTLPKVVATQSVDFR